MQGRKRLKVFLLRRTQGRKRLKVFLVVEERELRPSLFFALVAMLWWCYPSSIALDRSRLITTMSPWLIHVGVVWHLARRTGPYHWSDTPKRDESLWLSCHSSDNKRMSSTKWRVLHTSSASSATIYKKKGTPVATYFQPFGHDVHILRVGSKLFYRVYQGVFTRAVMCDSPWVHQ
jgi:hypothetical protein